MKKAILLTLALASIGWVAAAAPMISVGNPIYAVTVQSGSLVSHTFVLTNVGDEVLQITSVETSCGCTTAALAKPTLAPGESVDIATSVDTAGFRGTVTRAVMVKSNDPVSSTAMLQIVVTIAETVAPAVEEISIAELASFFFVLIDVRTPEEYAAGHLLGAMNVPLAEFQTNLDTWLPRLARDVPIVVYCLAGVRSLQAATILVDAGLTNVRNLAGGISVWEETFGTRFLFAW